MKTKYITLGVLIISVYIFLLLILWPTKATTVSVPVQEVAIEQEIIVVKTAKELNQEQETWKSKVIQILIECESNGRNIKIVDTNGYYSYGVLQFQKSTWDDFSTKSGIIGSPMNYRDSIRMASWAIMNGYGKRWTCWKNVPKELQSMPETI